MRNELGQWEGKRVRWEATVIRFGQEWFGAVRRLENGQPQRKTVCLGPVRLLKTGDEVAEHVWLVMSLRLSRLKLKVGDTIAFDATVIGYWKGLYFAPEQIDNKVIDYTLTAPSAFAVLRAGERQKQLEYGI